MQPVVRAEAPLERTKRRAWRKKLRRKAFKEVLKAGRKNLEAAIQAATISSVVGSGSVKKRKKKKSKKLVQNEEPTSVVEGPSGKDIVRDGYKKLNAGRFRFLNEQLYTMTGGEALEYFRQDPEAFRFYHTGFSEQAKKWPVHPLHVIIKWLKAKPNCQVVFDLGCGDAEIASTVGDVHEVHSFDLVAVNSAVTECDMAHLPVNDSTADIVIFCLSLMGTDVVDYIRESHRVLKFGGILKIAEVVSRFTNVKLFCTAVCKLGFTLKEKKQLTDYFVLIEFQKAEKVENRRPFGLKLRPCVYKKR